MYLHQFKKTLLFFSFFLSSISITNAGKSVIKADTDTAMQNAILVHINKYRQQHGLNPLKMDNKIVKEAKKHSIDMANHTIPFGHKYFNSRIDRLHAQIKNSGAGAENVAYNYKDAQDVVKNWLRSPGHKRNIDGNYNITGIGIASDKQGKIYFTQIFLKTGNSNKYAVRRPFSTLFNGSIFKRSV